MVLNTPVQPGSPVLIDNKEDVFKSSPASNNNEAPPRSCSDDASSPVVVTPDTCGPGPRAQSEQAATPVRSLPSVVEGVGMPSGPNIMVPRRKIQFPRYLPRAPLKEISLAALEAADADLKDVTMKYIHEKLQSIGKRLYTVATTTTGRKVPRGCFTSLDVVVNDLGADPPTNLLAVRTSPPTTAAIYAVHAVVLAAHCAHLPPLPYSKPTIPTEVGGILTLPCFSICLPDPATFPILLHYLYTKDRDHLFASLLPAVPEGVTQSLESSQADAATVKREVLLWHTDRVYGLWRNVAALGVFDETLLTAIEKVWNELFIAHQKTQE